VAEVKEGVEIVVGDDVALSGFAVEGEHDEEDFVTGEAVFEMTVEWEDGGVVFGRVGRSLLEIDGEKGEAAANGLGLGWAAGEVEELKELPAVLLSVAVVSEQREKEIKFAEFEGGVGGVGEERRKGPGVEVLFLLDVKERPGGFGAVARGESEWELVIDGAEAESWGWEVKEIGAFGGRG